jgi:hypothetical protein
VDPEVGVQTAKHLVARTAGTAGLLTSALAQQGLSECERSRQFANTWRTKKKVCMTHPVLHNRLLQGGHGPVLTDNSFPTHTVDLWLTSIRAILARHELVIIAWGNVET